MIHHDLNLNKNGHILDDQADQKIAMKFENLSRVLTITLIILNHPDTKHLLFLLYYFRDLEFFKISSKYFLNKLRNDEFFVKINL